MNRPLLLAFTALSALASGWALYLVQLHNDAVAHLLEPGALCSDGSCGAVLASEWATIGGIAVSAPAAPVFAVLAVLGGLALANKVEVERVSGLATLIGLAGIGFGGFLLFQMLVNIQQICQYCLVMDALTLGVLLTGAAMHPDGFVAAFKELGGTLAKLATPGPELALVGAAIVFTPIVTLALPEPEPPSEPVVVVVEEEDAPPAPPSANEPPAKPTAAEPPKTRRVVIPKEVADIPLGPTIPVKGKADAPITIVMFEDFQCPFCRKLAGNLELIANERPDQVRFAWYHFPMHQDCNVAELAKSLHPFACDAAKASECARQQDQFWPMHDQLFHNSAHLKARDLQRYAQEVGLDMGRFGACMRDTKTLDKVMADTAVGADLKVRGTPAFFVNGRRFSGAQPPEAIRAIIDAIAANPDDRVLLDVEMVGEVTGEVRGKPATVQVPGPYGPVRIDAFEASIEAGKAVSKPGVEPARNISWYDAQKACEAAGKRLCTEEEWLAACTGANPIDADGDGLYSDDPIQGRLHPYGMYPQESLCAASRKKDDPRPLITGNHPQCVTPTGIYDLEGVVKEWVGLDPSSAGVKGGSYYSIGSARCGYFKDSLPPDLQDPSTGFRCCEGPLPAALTAKHHPGGKVGDALLDFELPTLDGGTLSRADLKGKPAILTFWASWCGPCRQEMPALSEMYDKYRDEGLVVVGVNVDKVTPKAKAFLRQTPVTFPIAVDADSAFMERFDTRGVPTSFWITRSGEIRQRSVGYHESAKAQLEPDVQALMAAE